MKWKKLGKALLFPHIAIMIMLIPIATVFLVYSASKAISLAAACVSMLTLESTMLTTFGDDTMDITSRRIMLGASGTMISIFIIIMAIYMIVQGTKRIKMLSTTEEQNNGY